MLQHYRTIAKKQAQHERRGVRYTDEEKDIGLYNYMMAGKRYHKFLVGNLPVISRSTLSRHLKASTKCIDEGKLFNWALLVTL